MAPTPNTRNKLQTEEITNAVRTELNRALGSDEIANKLVSALQKTLIEEITPIITKKVTENIREYIEFELQSRDNLITSLETKIQTLLDQQDETEQYSRINCLVFHGVEERENENTNETIISLCDKKLGIKLSERDIDRSHRVGPSKEKKSRGVIVKFTNYQARDQIYKKRKLLRTSQDGAIYIHESLTRLRSELFRKVKNNFRDVLEALWTQDGRILCIHKQSKSVSQSQGKVTCTS